MKNEVSKEEQFLCSAVRALPCYPVGRAGRPHAHEVTKRPSPTQHCHQAHHSAAPRRCKTTPTNRTTPQHTNQHPDLATANCCSSSHYSSPRVTLGGSVAPSEHAPTAQHPSAAVRTTLITQLHSSHACWRQEGLEHRLQHRLRRLHLILQALRSQRVQPVITPVICQRHLYST